MIRTKGEAGTGNVVEAVRHMRTIMGEIRQLQTLDEDELYVAAKELPAPLELVKWVAENGKLPVVNFSAGGIATPADAALMMQLGAEGVFVGSGIFKSEDPQSRANAIVKAATNYRDAGHPGRGQRRPGRRHARHRRRAHARRGQDPAPRLVRRRGQRDSSERQAAAGLDPVARAGARPARSGRRARTSACSPCRAISASTGSCSSGSARAPVRCASRRDLAGLDGLVIPGGESTTISKLMAAYGLAEPIRAFAAGGGAVYGTCAGLITVARDHRRGPAAHARAHGHRGASQRVRTPGAQLRSRPRGRRVLGGPVHAVFIRAPWVERRRRASRSWPSTTATSWPLARATSS